MAATTFEEAKECPKCGKPGQDIESKATTKKGVSVHIIECKTELCPWFETTWLIQVNADGSIPEPMSALGPKLFTVDPDAQALQEKIEQGLQAQIAAETRPGGGAEVRNPYG
jgi:hypothetical protein